MGHELPGLFVPNIPRDTSEIEAFLPQYNRPELNRPLTNLFLGVAVGERAVYPIEIDLLKRKINTIYIVGRGGAGKEKMLKGIINYACERTAKGFLDLNVITPHGNPNEIADTGIIKRHMGGTNFAQAPEGVIAGKILENISSKLKARGPRNPSILVVDDLGFFLEKTGHDQERIDSLLKLMEYKGPVPFMTVVTIDRTDLPKLAAQGIKIGGKDTGIWFFENKKPDRFSQLDTKSKKMLPYSIFPFES